MARPAAPKSRRGTHEVFIDFENFSLGLYDLQDTTKSPFGSAREMINMQVTDRGGIAPRPGTLLLGTKQTTGGGLNGLYNFRKSFEQDEFLIKAYDDELEIYSKNHSDDWSRLKNGFTADKEFGFVTSLVNTDQDDYVIFCNRYEPYQRWQGSVTNLSATLAGAETSVVVDSVLTDEIFFSGTATGSSATTLTVSSATWTNDQFINMYVYIKSGVHANKIRKITDNTSTQITFDTLGSDPGSCSFEIRMAAFPASGTIIYNGTTIAYTAIPEYNKFTVASAHASAGDDDLVAIVPTEYSGNPRGNRMTNYLGRIMVGNVRSAMARDSGGALQGYASAGSYFVSKINNPVDFGYSATRVAGEGDIIGTPYGGGDITDVVAQEDAAYVFKRKYIEAIKYSQDTSDLAVREPLKAQIGARVPVIKGADDVYFITDDNAFTSIGRTLAKDVLPQTTDIGYKIKRKLEGFVFDYGRGIEYKNRVFIPAKSDSTQSENDILVVYNRNSDSFWGIWQIPANFLEEFNDKLYCGDSILPNVYEMFNGTSDVDGDDRYPITASYATHFMNLTPSDGSLQAINGMYYEGYISGDTVITFKVWKDFEDEPFLEFNFEGTEEQFQTSSDISAYLGGTPIGLRPHGTIGDPDEDGRRHFFFRVYFPFQYGYHFSLGCSSSGTDYDYEVTRMGMLLKSTVTSDATKIKSI